MTLRATSRLSSALVVTAAGVLVGCARAGTDSPRPPVHTALVPVPPAAHTTLNHSGQGAAPTCPGQASAFAVSFAHGVSGEATPLAAARRFVAHGGTPGYGTPATRWRIGAHIGRDGVLLIGDNVTLTVVRFPDRTWAVDGGQRCI